MRTIIKTLAFGVLFLSVPTVINAETPVTMEEVKKHNVPGDCYMVFENSVYDITDDRLNFHGTNYLDIEEWCGKDITQDFKDKAGEGRDHLESSYTLLEKYYLGELATTTESPIEPTIESSNETTTSRISSRYNIIVPVIGMLLLFFVTRFLQNSKKPDGKPRLKRSTYRAIWNTILLLSLIPSAFVGVFMSLRTKFPELYDINFDFLYWHVEGGIVFVVGTVLHVLDRLTIYFAQLRAVGKKRE